jgi:hypothetical protein
VQAFLLKLLVQAVENEQIRKFLLEVVDRIAGLLLPKLADLVPVAVGTAVDAAIKQIPGVENLKDVGAVVNSTRDTLNHLIPDFDTGVKALDDLLDMWRPR